VKKKLKI